MFEQLIDYVYIIPSVLIAIILHELSHGLVSTWFGDPTPKRQGRLSLNPLKHIDPIGALCLILFRFGWAKPVVINPDYYKKKRLGVICVSLAGIITNFTLAIFAIFVLISLVIIFKDKLPYQVISFLQYFSFINFGLGLFNLLPIPPLDGSKVLTSFLSEEAYQKFRKFEPYGIIILALVLFLGRLRNGETSILSLIVVNIYNFFVDVFIKFYSLF